jgi:hypothetical protein
MFFAVQAQVPACWEAALGDGGEDGDGCSGVELEVVTVKVVNNIGKAT